MNSRDLLNKSEKVFIFLDLDSLSTKLEREDRYLIALLEYVNFKQFNFIKSSSAFDNELIQKIPEYKLILSEGHETNPISVGSLIITDKGNQKVFPFGYKMGYIPLHAEQIFGKEEINEEQYNTIKQLFVQATFSQLASHSSNKSECYLFITENVDLLKNRLLLENRFGFPLNIMTLEEGNQFLDLVLKKNNKYLIRCNYSSNKGYLYELALKLNLPHLTYFDSITTGMSYRAEYALMAVDEIGFQHYLGVNNDTNDTALYHFHYLIMLITGIFDNLALKTDEILKINYEEKRKIGLSTKCCDGFLKEIRERNPEIRNHINNYVDFIKLMYYFRERVIHREGLSVVTFHHNHRDDDWLGSFIKATEEVALLTKRCGDKNLEYDAVTKWGIYKSYKEYFVMPYFFSISAVETLFEFTDKFLELLGFQLRIPKSETKRDLEIYKKYSLGIL